jgi:hypothetical protein
VGNFVWPTALVLLIISSIATPVPFVSSCRRAIAASPHKRSFAIGYFFVASYTAIGICTIVLIPFRAASGIGKIRGPSAVKQPFTKDCNGSKAGSANQIFAEGD